MCRPALPLQVLWADRLSKTDVGLGNQNVHGLQYRGRFGRLRLVFESARQISRNAAGPESDDENENACGIHTLTGLLLRGLLGFYVGESFFRKHD